MESFSDYVARLYGELRGVKDTILDFYNTLNTEDKVRFSSYIKLDQKHALEKEDVWTLEITAKRLAFSIPILSLDVLIQYISGPKSDSEIMSSGGKEWLMSNGLIVEVANNSEFEHCAANFLGWRVYNYSQANGV